MPAPPVVIRVSAAVDAGLERAFSTAEQRATRAGRVMREAATRAASETSASVQKEYNRQKASLDRAAAAQDKLYERQAASAARAAAKGVSAQERAAAQAARAADRQTRVVERAAERQARAAEKANTRWANSFTVIARVAEREMARVEKAQQKANFNERQKFADRVSYGASRFLTPHAPLSSIARRTAGEIARGVGVDFDISSSIQRGVALESSATALSNQGYEPGQSGVNGSRVDPKSLIAQARGINAKYGTLSSTEAIGGLEAFVTKTGDLNTGRAVLESMARLAVATGAGLESAVDAAGDVSLALGDVPNKGARIAEIMNVIAGQGKLGAVEVKDMASQMAKIGASATQFVGDPGKNIELLGAFAQVSRAKGGASSATMAATSVASFVNILKTPARVKAFRKEGIDVYDKATGLIRNPMDIIREALAKTNGDALRMKSMFANVQGARPVEGFANVYRQAGGGQTGMDAVNAMLNKFLEAGLNGDAIKDNIAAANQTTEAKAKQFQEKMDQVAESVRAKLMPALDALAPSALKLADTLGKVATWAVENPKMAIGAAIATSIARAGIENALRAGIEKLIVGNGSGPVGAGGTGGKGVGGIVGAATVAGQMMTIASMAVTTFTVGTMIIDYLFDRSRKEANDATGRDLQNFNERDAAKRLMANGSPQAMAEAKKILDEQKSRIEKENDDKLSPNTVDSLDPEKGGWNHYEFGDSAPEPMSKETAAKYQNPEEKQQMDQNNKSLAEVAGLLKQLVAQGPGGGFKLDGHGPVMPGRATQ